LSKLNERIKTLPGNTPRDLQMEVKGPKVWEEKLAMDKKVLKSYGWSGQQTKSKEGKQRQRKRYVSKAKKVEAKTVCHDLIMQKKVKNSRHTNT